MGVDVRCTTVPGADVLSVAKAIGHMMGLKPVMLKGKLWYKGLCLEHAIVTPGMYQISFLIGTGRRSCTFFESHSGGRGEGMMSGRSNILWVAAGKKLVEYFGGKMNYQDYDTSKPDFQSRGLLNLDVLDGADEVQARKSLDMQILKLPKLLPKEVKELQPECAYGEVEDVEQIMEFLRINKSSLEAEILLKKTKIRKDVPRSKGIRI